MKRHLSTILELAGMASVTAGAFFVAGIGIALIVGGVCAIIVRQGIPE